MRNYLKEVLDLEDSLRVFLIIGMAFVVLLLLIICSTTDVAVQAAARQQGTSSQHKSVEIMGMNMQM